VVVPGGRAREQRLRPGPSRGAWPKPPGIRRELRPTSSFGRLPLDPQALAGLVRDFARSCTLVDAMAENKTLEAARDAYRRRAWADAADLFLRADAETELAIEDLEALVWAAGIAARDREMLAALERVYAHHAAREDHEACARAAFWSGLRYMMTGEVGHGAGWLQRAAKHAEETAPDCVQRGYLLLPQVFMHRAKQAYATAVEIADRAIAIGERAGEPDLIALAGSLKGGMLFRLGRIDEGYVPID
jgi:tetratricopeptide (TPR) repeat protein